VRAPEPNPLLRAGDAVCALSWSCGGAVLLEPSGSGGDPALFVPHVCRTISVGWAGENEAEFEFRNRVSSWAAGTSARAAA